MEFLYLILLAIAIGLGVAIPFAIHLVKYVKLTIKEENFNRLVTISLGLIEKAEANYITGEERKKYVMDSIIALCEDSHCDIDLDKISDMIDAIVATSKKINIKK